MKTDTRSRAIAAPTPTRQLPPPEAAGLSVVKTQMAQALDALADVLRLRDQLLGTKPMQPIEPSPDDAPVMIDLATRGNVLSTYTDEVWAALAEIRKELGL